MSKLLILGAGGYGKVIAECALETGRYDDIAFVDDDDSKLGQTVLDFPVIGKVSNSKMFRGVYSDAFVAIGSNRTRVNFINELVMQGYHIPCLVHPFSHVSKFSRILQGTAILAGAVVGAGARLGEGNIINTSASVDHECILGKGVHISPGARLGGNVTVKDFSWVCIGASVANDVLVGSGSIVAAGAVVLKDVQSNVLVAGVPAVEKRRLLRNEAKDLFVPAPYEWERDAVHTGGI